MSERINNEVFCFCFCSVRVRACVCMRVGLVQTATSANTLWKTNSVGVDGISRQRSSSDLPAVHPPLPPLRVTSTSTFFFPPFSFLAGGPCESGRQGRHCSCGLHTDTHQMLPPRPRPLQPPPQAPTHSLATPKMTHSLFCLARYFNSIHT